VVGRRHFLSREALAAELEALTKRKPRSAAKSAPVDRESPCRRGWRWRFGQRRDRDP
jgi:hypothetical protein